MTTMRAGMAEGQGRLAKLPNLEVSLQTCHPCINWPDARDSRVDVGALYPSDGEHGLLASHWPPLFSSVLSVSDAARVSASASATASWLSEPPRPRRLPVASRVLSCPASSPRGGNRERRGSWIGSPRDPGVRTSRYSRRPGFRLLLVPTAISSSLQLTQGCRVPVMLDCLLVSSASFRGVRRSDYWRLARAPQRS